MQSGSMIIPNSLGTVTTLIIVGSKTFSIPADDSSDSPRSLQEARAALNREQSSPSRKEGNIHFLKEYIRLASITPPNKTSVRLLNQPWEKQEFNKNESLGDSNIGIMSSKVSSKVTSSITLPGKTSSITPPEKTSFRIQGQPWKKA